MKRTASQWRKSSYSGEEGGSTCVEVAALAPAVGLRDSKDPEGPCLHLTHAAFDALLADVKADVHR